MSFFKVNQLLKKKSRLLPFLIVCSFFISENALAFYGKKDCSVMPYNTSKDDFITINFKFFEYHTKQGPECSYIKDFEVLYSTDGGFRYTHLMSASTEAQTTNNWAWIDISNKKFAEKIKLFMRPRDRANYKDGLKWKDDTGCRFNVAAFEGTKKMGFGVNWYPKFDVTHIQIKLKWYNYSLSKTEDITFTFQAYLKYFNLNSCNLDFSNSYPKQEIRTEVKNKSVKAYKEANAIVIEGAQNEKIGVYTTTGVLVKSIVANDYVVNIKLPTDQIYIVKAGQKCVLL